jgi:hypothetical protein
MKNPTASAGFEPANLGTRGRNASSRPPKPLDPHVTVFLYPHLRSLLPVLNRNLFVQLVRILIRRKKYVPYTCIRGYYCTYLRNNKCTSIIIKFYRCAFVFCYIKTSDFRNHVFKKNTYAPLVGQCF